MKSVTGACPASAALPPHTGDVGVEGAFRYPQGRGRTPIAAALVDGLQQLKLPHRCRFVQLRVDFGHADLLIRGRHRPCVAVLSDIIRVARSRACQLLIVSAAVSE